MQIEALSQIKPQQSELLQSITTNMPCHTADQSSQAIDDLKNSHSKCGQCCIAAALISIEPQPITLAVSSAKVTAALFNNLPAPAQRPAKPPLV